MTERTTYQPGVPCWVDTLQTDPERARTFYSGLFGWEFVGSDEYSVARLRDRDVAGLGAQPTDGAPQGSAWTTHIATASLSETMTGVSSAGGTVAAGPVDASPAGGLAVVSDPSGALFALWEAKVRQGAQLVDEPSAWSMSALQTVDPEAAQAFYADVFGWTYETFEFGSSRIVLCRLPGYVGGTPSQPVPRDVVAVIVLSDETDSKSHWAVDFWIEDTDEAAARAPELGGSVVVQPHATPGFRSAVLADPGGAEFSINTLQK